jgi:hypothetical protein
VVVEAREKRDRVAQLSTETDDVSMRQWKSALSIVQHRSQLLLLHLIGSDTVVLSFYWRRREKVETCSGDHDDE